MWPQGYFFHQFSLSLGFFYSLRFGIVVWMSRRSPPRILQRQVYDLLELSPASGVWSCWFSTHSEIILEIQRSKFSRFMAAPHRLKVDTHRDQVREALKRLSSLDLLSPRTARIFSTLKTNPTLRFWQSSPAFSRIDFRRFAAAPFVCPYHGPHAREARAHFFGLKAIRPQVKGVLLLDGDNREPA